MAKTYMADGRCSAMSYFDYNMNAQRWFLEQDRTNFIHCVAHYLTTAYIPSHPNGFTFDLFSHGLPICDHNAFQELYFVALHGYEKPYPEVPEVQNISRYIENNLNWLCIPDHYLGGWPSRKRNVYCLDRSIPICGYVQAKRFAQSQGQEDIFHPASGKAIPVPPLSIAM